MTIRSSVRPLRGNAVARSAMLLLAAAVAVPLTAGPITFTYPSLAPGSQFRIAFVTSTVGTGTSQNISTYNTFVNSAANAGGSELAFLGATWTAIVSTGGSGVTTSVSAATNIGGASALPIYTLDGTLVANGTSGLFSGTLLSAIDIEETGTLVTGVVKAYTGSNADGSVDSFGHGLGNAFGDFETGAITSTASSWLHFVDQSGAANTLQFYGISGTLTVPENTSPAPEPGTLGLMLAGGAGMLCLLKRRR